MDVKRLLDPGAAPAPVNCSQTVEEQNRLRNDADRFALLGCLMPVSGAWTVALA